MSFDTSTWIALIGGGAIVAGSWTIVVPQHWRGQRMKADRDSVAFLPIGLAAKRGLRRATPVVAVGGTLGYIAVVLGIIASSMHGGLRTALLAGALVAVGLMFCTGVLAVGVILLNRPKIIVAPPHRMEPGALATWRRVRHIRRVRKG
jgi:hypothetical protein